jgi:HK97 family phage portal protein
VILATRTGDRAVRGLTGLNDLLSSRGLATRDGVAVTAGAVAGLPAASRAISVAAEAVGKLELGIWRGKGVDRRRVATTWQARFFSGQPNERDTWQLVWEQTEASLTARNSAYWLKIPNETTGQVEAVYVKHPSHVDLRWNTKTRRIEYRVRVDFNSPWSGWITSADILHFRVGFADPGCLVPPTPIELHRDSLGAALARVRYEGGFYERGHAGVAAVFPGEVSPEQAKKWEAVYRSAGGVDNAHGIRVFGGGATLERIGLTLDDAQFVESQSLSIDDCARIFRVQSSLLGGGQKTDRPITPEHEEDRWLRYGLGPRLTRIEAFIAADPSFFGPGARDYPLFDTEGVLRGDLATEAEISLKKVQSGQWLVDEARARDGLAPLPNGAGQIPQVVPVGGQQNPVPTPPADPDEDDS